MKIELTLFLPFFPPGGNYLPSTMDPLSAIASIAGVITAASKIIDVVSPYTAAKKRAPEIAAQLHAEALATKTI